MTEQARDAGRKKGTLGKLLSRLEAENRQEAERRLNRATALRLARNYYWVSVCGTAAQIARWDGNKWRVTGGREGFAPEEVAVLSDSIASPEGVDSPVAAHPIPRTVAWGVPPCGCAG